MGTVATEAVSARIEEEVAAFAVCLPMAEQLNGGLIRLAGAGGYFNPNSLLESNWLKGKMTTEEYRSAINYINSCAIRSQSEIKTSTWPQGAHEREKTKATAGEEAAQEINAQHKSVRFTYQQSVEKVEYIPVYSLNLLSHISVLSEKGRYLTVC